MQAKNDIQNREDIEALLHHFYKKILADPFINYIFIDVAKMDIETHIPVIADFWETVLFQTGSYQKNAIKVHQELNKKSPLTSEHFKSWLKYFDQSVDELFTGPNAFLIKQRALSISTIMQIKLRQLSS